MSDKREFDLTFERGYFEEDDSLQIHERGVDEDYYLSGAEARKFMRNRSDLEVSSKDKDSIYFRDKVTGEIYAASAPDHTLGALILGASFFGFYHILLTFQGGLTFAKQDFVINGVTKQITSGDKFYRFQLLLQRLLFFFRFQQ